MDLKHGRGLGPSPDRSNGGDFADFSFNDSELYMSSAGSRNGGGGGLDASQMSSVGFPATPSADFRPNRGSLSYGRSTGKASRGKSAAAAGFGAKTPEFTPIAKERDSIGGHATHLFSTSKPSPNASTDAYPVINDSHINATATGEKQLTVRVFGFPPNKAQAIVAEFQRKGEIVRRMEGYSNWMDIEFTSPMVVESALAMNGKIIDGVMIGVMRLNEQGGHLNHNLDRSYRQTPGMRYRNASRKHAKGGRRPHAALPKTLNDIWGYDSARGPVPQSICSKIMEYVFQW
mmetsp:Transcript_30111/g.52916  ORF Transcript_30111/g.52916 Transcript_30111/m.52916 type:complete len:289 (+) Transcript_30111:95-961(+)